MEAATHADSIDHMANRGYPGFAMTVVEFNDMKGVPAADRENAISARFDAALAPGGDPDVPFADVIGEATGRATLKSRLLAMKWTLCRATSQDLVIGDAGILLERGDSSTGCSVVVGPDLAILIRDREECDSDTIVDGALEPWLVDAINYETTARSRRLLVGHGREILETVKKNLWRQN